MDEKTTISVQIPGEWKSRLESLAESQHLKLSDIVRLIIVAYLRKTSEDTPAPEADEANERKTK